MEDLNKQQLILLVLLVSFVTSIATGIITVSLIDKAPVEVVQTINRVVERTVETVVPGDIEPEEKVVTVRETVVVTEEERVVDAISKNKPVVVRIFQDGNIFRAIGSIQSGSGEVATANGDYSQAFSYQAHFENGDTVPIEFMRRDQENGSAYFRLQGEEGKTFTAGSFDSSGLKLGQQVIAISGEDRNIVSTGLVSDLVGDTQITTNFSTASMQPGSVLLNLSGDIVGILSQNKIFIPVQKFLALEPVDTSNTASAGQSTQ